MESQNLGLTLIVLTFALCLTILMMSVIPGLLAIIGLPLLVSGIFASPLLLIFLGVTLYTGAFNSKQKNTLKTPHILGIVAILFLTMCCLVMNIPQQVAFAFSKPPFMNQLDLDIPVNVQVPLWSAFEKLIHVL